MFTKINLTNTKKNNWTEDKEGTNSYCNPEISIWEKSKLVKLSDVAVVCEVMRRPFTFPGGDSSDEGCFIAITLQPKFLVTSIPLIAHLHIDRVITNSESLVIMTP